MAQLQEFLEELESSGLLQDDAVPPAALAACGTDAAYVASDASPEPMRVDTFVTSAASGVSSSEPGNPEGSVDDSYQRTASMSPAAPLVSLGSPQQGPEKAKGQDAPVGAQTEDDETEYKPDAAPPHVSSAQQQEASLEQSEQRILGQLAGAEVRSCQTVTMAVSDASIA